LTDVLEYPQINKFAVSSNWSPSGVTMEARLTFGEYMRRLRRSRKWSLHTLADESGISYTHLSRLENDSTVPSAESVVRLAEVLDGDLKAMLEMSGCLPRVILDRISSLEPQANSLKRTAGLPGQAPDGPDSGQDDKLVTELQRLFHLDEEDARALAQGIGGLASLEKSQRSLVITLISSLSTQEGTAD
jgi:transcriptional regulator with XRE-family HTH domain